MTNIFLIIVVAVVFLVWFYILILREFLVEMWPDRFSRWHHIEDRLWRRSRTLLVARLYIVGSVIIAIHDALATQTNLNWTPLIKQIASVVPEEYRPIAVAVWLAVVGLSMEWLRRQTTGTVAEAEKKA